MLDVQQFASKLLSWVYGPLGYEREEAKLFSFLHLANFQEQFFLVHSQVIRVKRIIKSLSGMDYVALWLAFAS